MSNRIDICFTSDENYAQHMAVAIMSILINADKNDEFSFWIVDDNISENSKKKIDILKKIKDFDISYIVVNKDEFKDFPFRKDYVSSNSYYLLKVPSILKNNDRLLFLDCDVVVQKSLAPLFFMDLDGRCIAAAEDIHAKRHKERMGILDKFLYFNSGVFLLDCEKWRNNHMEEKCFEYVKRNGKNFVLQDQEVLNGVLHNDVKEIDLKWNFQHVHNYVGDFDKNYYEEIKKDPSVIHYITGDKPWNRDDLNCLSIEYWNYLMKTSFFEGDIVNTFMGKMKTSINKLKKINEVQEEVDFWRGQENILTKRVNILEEELSNIKKSLRWKIPNYFYKLYKNNLKKYVPRFLFLILKPIFNFLEEIRNINKLTHLRFFNFLQIKRVLISKEIKNELISHINHRGNDSFDIICFSIIPYKYRHQRPQHLMEGLATKGHRIFWIENDFIVTKNGRSKISLEKEKDNVFIVRISSKDHVDIYSQEATSGDVQKFIDSIKLLIQQANIINPIAKIDHPFWECIVDQISMPVVYDCMDNHAGFDDNRSLDIREKSLIEKSDLLITTSNYLTDKYKDISKEHVEIRNAGEFKFFNNVYNQNPEMPQDLEKFKNKKIIGYYGALANWFDLQILKTIAKDHADKEFILIGNCVYQPILDLAKDHANIHLLGEKNYRDIPSYLYHFDLCIIPFVLNELIKATDPVKLYEYFAMGKKVIATKMPEILRFEENMWFAENHSDFSKKIEIALNQDDSVDSKKSRLEISRNNTWHERCERLDKILKKKFFPKVSIITLSYNKKHFTEDFLASYFDRSFYPNTDLIIIDNASDAETVDFLKNVQEKNFANVDIVFNEKNLGFSGGNNLGMKKAIGEYVILINNDTKVTPGWISRLVFHVNQQNTGLVGPVTNNIGNESKISISYNQKSQSEIEEKALIYTSTHWGHKLELDRIAAFCWILSKKTYEKIGGFDERFFPAYYEDDDYCMRIKNAGYKIYCADDVFIHHFENGSVGKNENKKLLIASKKKFDEKWGKNVWKPHKRR